MRCLRAHPRLSLDYQTHHFNRWFIRVHTPAFATGTYYRNDELNLESQEFPLVLDLKRRIANDRASAAGADAGATAATPFDRWFLFAALDQLYYYNFADGQASWEAPHFALHAAHQIQKVARGRSGRAAFQKKRQFRAATRIQASYRSKVARISVGEMSK